MDSVPTVYSVSLLIVHWHPLTAELLIFYGKYLHLIYMGIRYLMLQATQHGLGLLDGIQTHL